MDKKTNNGSQNTAQGTKDWTTLKPQKPRENLGDAVGKALHAPHVTSVVLLLLKWLINIYC